MADSPKKKIKSFTNSPVKKPKKDYVEFTKEMKESGYKMLIPTMLPMHLRLVARILNTYGYDCEVLDFSGREVVENGLRYVHNDTCYPALLVIGQFITALQSGKYDPDKTALFLSQTGGGCRASNYISLLRKALKKAGYENLPVISFNVLGMEKHSGFKLTLKMLYSFLIAVIYGDLLLLLENQCRPYEKNEGDTLRMSEKWTNILADDIRGKNGTKFERVKENYKKIIDDYDSIPHTQRRTKPLVGVVGEIFVKFSPLGNNNLCDFLISEGAEATYPGMLDFVMYYAYNLIEDSRLYGERVAFGLGGKIGYNYLKKKQAELIKIIKEDGRFVPPSYFPHTISLSEGYISHGVKMGEGWLLVSEMLELADAGVNNIICTQPFGCLPNHIAGKGMMKPIREKNPGVNIVAIDYDPGASVINQQNRIKLMLANVKNKEAEAKAAAENNENKE